MLVAFLGKYKFSDPILNMIEFIYFPEKKIVSNVTFDLKGFFGKYMTFCGIF